MALQLYSYWRSSAAYRVRIALHYKGLAFETVPTHLLRDGGEQRKADYLAVNPQGLVPALADDGQVIPQSLAICEYLEEVFPRPALLPADPRSRAAVRAMALAVACDIHPLNNLSVLMYLRGELRQGDAAVTRWTSHWIDRGFTALEQLIARNSADGLHCFGASVTLADVFLVPQVANSRRVQLDLAPYPTLARVAQHLESLPAFLAARPESQPDAE